MIRIAAANEEDAMEDDDDGDDGLRTLDEIMRAEARKRPATKWGKWELDTGDLWLVYDPEGICYEINLQKIDSSGMALAHIFDLWAKSWCSPQDMWDVQTAFRTILDPLVNYCPGGIERVSDGSELVKRYVARVLTHE